MKQNPTLSNRDFLLTIHAGERKKLGSHLLLQLCLYIERDFVDVRHYNLHFRICFNTLLLREE